VNSENVVVHSQVCDAVPNPPIPSISSLFKSIFRWFVPKPQEVESKQSSRLHAHLTIRMTFTDIFSLGKSHQDDLQEQEFVRVSNLGRVQTRNVSTLTDGRIDQAIDVTIIEDRKKIPFCRDV
jgi:hypothetical protein